MGERKEEGKKYGQKYGILSSKKEHVFHPLQPKERETGNDLS